MATIPETIGLALDEVDRLRTLLRKRKTPQIWSAEERTLIKATALTWFNSHRGDCAALAASETFKGADGFYDQLLQGSDRAVARATYKRIIKELRHLLITLRSEGMVPVAAANTTDQPPAFAPLIADARMQKILEGRWKECVACIGCNASLAATVMMGGLLEALLLARIHRESNKAPIFASPKAPKDKTGKTHQLQEWGLKNYIDVAHDMGWITISARDVAEVLRDYRNYIHPHKQQSHNVNLSVEDAQLFWEVSKSISRQVLRSAGP